MLVSVSRGVDGSLTARMHTPAPACPQAYAARALGPWQSRTIRLSWPDQQGGKLELIVELLLLEGRWECVALRIGFPEGVAPRALQTADLRCLGMPVVG